MICYHKLGLVTVCQYLLFDANQRDLLLRVFSWPQFEHLRIRVQALENKSKEIDALRAKAFENMSEGTDDGSIVVGSIVEDDGVSERLYAEQKIMKEILAAGMSVGFGYLAGEQLFTALVQERLAEITALAQQRLAEIPTR